LEKELKKIVLSAILIILSSFIAFSQNLLHPINLDIEDGELNKMPVGWEMPGFAVS
jgi:hypothetical protein